MASFTRLVDSYSQTAEQFKLHRSRELFLKKILSEEEPPMGPTGSISEDELERAWNSLKEETAGAVALAAAVDKENRVIRVKKNYDNIDFAQRIAEMEDELLKIAQEQRAVDSLVERRAEKQLELLRERERVLDSRAGDSAAERTADLDSSLKDESARLVALLSGLEGLMNIRLKNISYNAASGDVRLDCKIDSCDAIFVLDSSRHLCNISLANNTVYINAADVLTHAQELKAPQDLRYAISFIGSAQQAPSCIKKDVAELRKKFIVQMNASEPPYSVHVSFMSGVTLQLSLHPCYSFVPNSVRVESISGNDQRLSVELESIMRCVCGTYSGSLLEAVEHFLRVLGGEQKD